MFINTSYSLKEKSYENKLSVRRNMPSLFSTSPKAFLAYVHISYDKPPPTPPSAVLFSLSGWSSVMLNVYLDYLKIFVYMINICLEIYELMPKKKYLKYKERTVSITKVVCKRKHAFA